jgi:putative FmdB family regulatory protein
MPIYEYKCMDCNSNVEVSRGFNDPDVAPMCTNCHGTMQRHYGSVGVQFKGSGFYKTDNPN